MGIDPINDALMINLQQPRDASEVQPVQIQRDGLVSDRLLIPARFGSRCVLVPARFAQIPLATRWIQAIFDLPGRIFTAWTFIHLTSLPCLFIFRHSRLMIDIQVEGTSGLLRLMKWVIQYVDYNGTPHIKTVTDSSKVELEEGISASPIGIYTMIDGTPSRVLFTVSTPFGKRTDVWQS